MASLTRKFLLTTGEVTSNVEDYILDLFKLYLVVYPGDIPHTPEIGFDFNMVGVMKDELRSTLESRANSLINLITNKIPSSEKIKLELQNITLINESTAKLSILLNGKLTDDLFIDIYNTKNN